MIFDTDNSILAKIERIAWVALISILAIILAVGIVMFSIAVFIACLKSSANIVLIILAITVLFIAFTMLIIGFIKMFEDIYYEWKFVIKELRRDESKK